MAQHVKVIPFSLEQYNILSNGTLSPDLVTSKGERVRDLKAFTLDDKSIVVVGVVNGNSIRSWNSTTGESDRSNGYSLKIVVEVVDADMFITIED